MNCKICGYTLKPEQHICPNCGIILDTTSNQTNSDGGSVRTAPEKTMVFQSVRKKTVNNSSAQQKQPKQQPQRPKKKKKNNGNAKVVVLSVALVISVILCIVLSMKLFGIFPFVEETTEPTTSATTTTSPYDVMFEYETIGENITITKYIGSESSVIIPSEINGKKVTKIGEKAFYQSIFLQKLTIQSSVIEIGEQAFSNCSHLASVILPDSLRTLGEQAFYDCSVLTYITVPTTVTNFGKYVFGDCESLTVECSISSEAYKYCKENNLKYKLMVGEIETTKKEENTLPPGLENTSDLNKIFVTEPYLDGIAIKGCNMKLSTITIPEQIDGKNVIAISDFAFSSNADITTVFIPQTVKSIGKYAFSYCTSLTTVDISSTDVEINEGAFLYSNNSNMRFKVPSDSTALNYATVHAIPYSIK